MAGRRYRAVGIGARSAAARGGMAVTEARAPRREAPHLAQYKKGAALDDAEGSPCCVVR